MKKTPQKILICGVYGSGKTTFANEVAVILKSQVYQLDEIKYKRKYDIIRTPAEKKKMIKDISNKTSWIAEGVAWTPESLIFYKKADLVILFQTKELELYRRVLIRYFKKIFNQEKYYKHNLKTTMGLMKRIKNYFHNPEFFMSLEKHKSRLKKYTKKSTIIKTKREKRIFLTHIKN